MFPNLFKSYADTVTIGICPYGSDCRHHIWLRSFDKRKPEYVCHYFKS